MRKGAAENARQMLNAGIQVGELGQILEGLIAQLRELDGVLADSLVYQYCDEDPLQESQP